MSIPWFLRLPRRALARRDVIERMARELHRDRKVDPGDAQHAFGFKCDELAFARELLASHPRFWLFRTHQQRRCGDFAAIDMSSPDLAHRAVRVLELKRAESLRVDRGAGLQLANAEALRAAIAEETGLVAGCAAIERITGDARVVARWLASA